MKLHRLLFFSFVSFIIFFFSQNVYASNNDIKCPCGDANVKCDSSCGAGWTVFKSGVTPLDCSFEPLTCNQEHHSPGRCCIKDDIDTCPKPAFCTTADLTGKGYVKVGDIECKVGTATGSCWIMSADGIYDQCIPSPNACNSQGTTYNPGGCASGEYCAYVNDGSEHYWACEKDTENICAKDCESNGGCCANFPESCGSDYVETLGHCDGNKTCYKSDSALDDCTSPAECKEKMFDSCPYDYTVAQGKCPPGQICCMLSDSACIEEGDPCCGGTFCDNPDLYCDTSTNPPTCKIYTGTEIPPGLKYKGPIIDSLDKLITPVAKILYFGGLFIGVFIIIYSGYQLMTSSGNPQKTQSAQEQLTAAILGIMFILLSAAILRVIINNLIGL